MMFIKLAVVGVLGAMGAVAAPPNPSEYGIIGSIVSDSADKISNWFPGKDGKDKSDKDSKDKMKKACAATTGQVGLPYASDCTKLIYCNEGVYDSVLTCSTAPNPWVSMFSTTRGYCVHTGFPDCKTQKKFCPTLPGTIYVNDNYRAEDDLPETLAEQILHVHGEVNEKNEFVVYDDYTVDNTFECPEEFGRYTIEGTPDYHFCARGKAYRGSCDANEVFDEKIQNCVDSRDTMKSSKGDETHHHDCSNMYDGIYGVPSCKKFQICCGEEASTHYCPIGKFYDNPSGRCALPHKATCYKEN